MTNLSRTHWQQFLIDHGASLDEAGQLRCAASSALFDPNEKPALVPLTDRAILEVRGPDSEKFLQGQTSASVAHATDTIAPPTVFCTPKGRAIANAQLIGAGEERYWLLLDRGIAEALRQHLAKYAVFYKTEIALRDDLVMAGLAGDGVADVIHPHMSMTVPDSMWGVGLSQQHDDVVLTCHPHDRHRLILIAPEGRAIDLCSEMMPNLRLLDGSLWNLLDIQAGLLWLRESQRESWLPQMFNWEALAGISFKKGCYTGQEVVARAHYRGQVKKRLMRLELDGNTAPALGTSIVDTTNDKSLGEVVSSAPADNGHCEVLAIVSIKDDMPQMVINNLPARLLPLPYALERRDPETLAG